MIDELLKEHEAAHQIDQNGCKQGSMGCIDNLLMDKAKLEDAQQEKHHLCMGRRKELVSVHKNAKRELGQYPAILTSRLVNNIYV